MKRGRLPRYGTTPGELTYERVHLARTSGKTDGYHARLWKVTRSAVRAARVGNTHKDHPTPPDTRERSSASRSLNGEAHVVSTPPADINQALRSWRCPDDSTVLTGER